jgi:glyoxylase-like metal-dependent hydrolase (beta-lactamase superfamily II)
MPGHTPGSVAVHPPPQGVVLTGDALVTHDGLLVFTHDTALARASLKALASFDAGLVLPGHGDPFHGAVADAVAQARNAPS